jgi:cytidylate kinase
LKEALFCNSSFAEHRPLYFCSNCPGPAACGKSTFTKQFAFSVAKQSIDEGLVRQLPAMVRVIDLARTITDNSKGEQTLTVRGIQKWYIQLCGKKRTAE